MMDSSLKHDSPLTPLELDAYVELLNMGVGKAASMLSDLANQTIQLSVPSAYFVRVDEAIHIVGAEINDSANGISQSFSGPFRGNALLVFPKKNSLELVRSLLGESVPLEEIGQLEQDSLREIGNVFLTGCLGVIADAFRKPILNSLPELFQGTAQQIIGPLCETGRDQIVSVLDVKFKLQKNNIDGIVVIVLEMQAIGQLKLCIHEYLRSQGVTIQ